MNPDGRTMRRYERELKATVLSAFEKLRGDLFAGVNEGTVMLVPSRMDDPRVYRPFRDSIVAGLQRIAIAGAEFGREQVERHVFGVKMVEGKQDGPLSIDWQLANNEAAEWALRYGYDLVRGITDTTRRRLQSEINRFIANSETLPDLIERLADLFGPVRADIVSSTEVTRAFAAGNQASWRESGVIQGQRWNASNDELQCVICGGLNGVVVALDASFPGGYPHPPAHPRCRCWITGVPIIEGDPQDA